MIISIKKMDCKVHLWNKQMKINIAYVALRRTLEQLKL
jgi:hypothetical protein